MHIRKKQKINETKILSAGNTLKTIYSILSPFLSAKDNMKFARVGKKFHSFYEQKSMWKKLYEKQFGKLYFDEDYKEQYLAEFWWREAACDSSQNGAKMLDLLYDLVTEHQNKKWSYFYCAKLANKNIFLSVHFGEKLALDYAIDSLKVK